MFFRPLSSPWCWTTVAPHYSRSSRIASWQASVCAQRCCTTGLLWSYKYDHVAQLLRDLHWLPFLERITFRLAVLAYRCQHGLAPSYLSADLHNVADADSRRWLRSTLTAALLVPRTRLLTVDDRAFPVAAARAWNNLPPSVTSATSLSTFRKRLRTELFSHRFLPWLFTCVSMYYFTCLSFLFIFFLSACAAHRIVPLQLNLAYSTLICSLTNYSVLLAWNLVCQTEMKSERRAPNV